MQLQFINPTVLIFNPWLQPISDKHKNIPQPSIDTIVVYIIMHKKNEPLVCDTNSPS